jgi:hypothetical protein
VVFVDENFMVVIRRDIVIIFVFRK